MSDLTRAQKLLSAWLKSGGRRWFKPHNELSELIAAEFSTIRAETAERERDETRTKLATVLRYAVHPMSCAKWGPSVPVSVACTCGLDAIAALRARQRGENTP